MYSTLAQSSTRALVLSGGGTVGRAWEMGIAAGLRALGIDLGRADRIIATSAGAVVGAELALGLDLDRAVPVVDPAPGSASSPALASSMQQLMTAIAHVVSAANREVV